MTILPKIIHPRINALAESSFIKRTGLREVEVLPSKFFIVLSFYKSEMEKAQKIAIDAQRDLYAVIKREMKQNQTITQLKRRLEFAENVINQNRSKTEN